MTLRNDYGERCQFDAYCKLMLYNEAIDCLREMQRRRDRELSFSDLPQMEMDKLCVVKLIEPSYTERYVRLSNDSKIQSDVRYFYLRFF